MPPKIRPLPLTADFMNLQMVSRSHGETNDCSAKALALVTGLSYSEARQMLALRGRKQGKSTSFFSLLDSIRAAGFNPININQNEITARYPGKHSSKVRVTSLQPVRFPKAWADGHTYLMLTAGHVLTVINGTVHDWSNGCSLDCIRLYRIVKA